jgi:hypothetical protein
MLCFQALPAKHYQPPTAQVRGVEPASSGGRGSAAGQERAAQGLASEEDLLKGRSFRVTVTRGAAQTEVSALASREVGRLSLSRVQLYADAFVAGPRRPNRSPATLGTRITL